MSSQTASTDAAESAGQAVAQNKSAFLRVSSTRGGQCRHGHTGHCKHWFHKKRHPCCFCSKLRR
jgi:hypothetical protein